MNKNNKVESSSEIPPMEMLAYFLHLGEYSLTDGQIDEIEKTLDDLILNPGSDQDEIKEIAEKLDMALAIADPNCDELEDARLAFTSGIDPRQVVDMVHKFRHIVSERDN